MNIVVEEKPNCEVTLHVEIPADRVSSEWRAVERDFQRHAKLPGFRPGRAPQALIAAKYAREIKDEVIQKLLRESINEAIESRDLKVLSVAEVGQVDVGPNQAMRYTATVVTSPQFELPEYNGIEVEAELRQVTDVELEEAMDNLRQSHASYEPIEGRGLAMGDFAVLSYKTQIDGKPLAEAVPDAPPILRGRDNFWLEMKEEAFLKGFCSHLLGALPGEDRSFDFSISEESPIEPLRGLVIHFDVTIHTINSKHLPEWTDELANQIAEGSDVAALRTLVRNNLERINSQQYEGSKRSEAIKKLLSQFDCELPAKMVNREMANILEEIIRENEVRGLSRDDIQKYQDEILGNAKQNARDRVRTRFLLMRIAEKEKIEVTEADLISRLAEMSSYYNIPMRKLIKDLEKRDGVAILREQILESKALDLVASNATVKGAPQIQS